MAVKIMGFVLVIAGALGVFLSTVITEKFSLWERIKCEFESEMEDSEIEKYRKMKASLNVKMIGMTILLPGLVILLLSFK